MDDHANNSYSYKIVTWNAGGLHKGSEHGRQRGDFLSRLWQENSNLEIMCVQETHCKSDGDLCQNVIDLKTRLNVLHSPAVEGDGWSGVLMIMTKDWEVIDSTVGVPGRVLSVKVRGKIFGEMLNFVVVYGKTGANDRGAWIDGLNDVMDLAYTSVVMGDFNFVTEERDRDGNALNGYDLTLRRKFSDKMGGWELRDVFRGIRGDEEEFTFSHIRGGRSRIDRVYMEDDMICKVSKIASVEVLGQTVGHKMVQVEIEEGLEIGPGYWKFNTAHLK